MDELGADADEITAGSKDSRGQVKALQVIP